MQIGECNMEWKYKIELADRKVFSEIEKDRGIVFPSDLKKLIIEANAATPSKYRFMVGSDERVLGSVLSFNKDDTDADTVFTAFDGITEKELIPFGIDPFGNYICYSINDKKVVFHDHETGTVSSTDKSLKEFLDALY